MAAKPDQGCRAVQLAICLDPAAAQAPLQPGRKEPLHPLAKLISAPFHQGLNPWNGPQVPQIRKIQAITPGLIAEGIPKPDGLAVALAFFVNCMWPAF